MNILQIIPILDPNNLWTGPHRVVFDISKRLSEKGHNVTISKSAKVNANIEANQIIVEGELSGDMNGDEVVNIFDITGLIGYLYLEGAAPDPIESGDANGDGTINIFDITYVISYLYLSGPEPDR